MSAYEIAKRNVALAAELAKAVAEGKIVELTSLGKRYVTAIKEADQFFDGLQAGVVYCVVEPKKRRPWTSAEAEARLGHVLVSPAGEKSVLTHVFEHAVRGICVSIPRAGADPSVNDLMDQNWRVYLPGHPDQLEPACVTE